MKRCDILNFEIYVGDQCYAEQINGVFTIKVEPEEWARFQDSVADHMGNVFNTWFSTHPEEYKKI